MSSCCTLRLNRRNAFSRDSPSCSRTSAKPTHPQTRPVGPDSYFKDLTLSQEGMAEISLIIYLTDQAPGKKLFPRSHPTTGWPRSGTLVFRSPMFPFLGRRTEEYG